MARSKKIAEVVETPVAVETPVETAPVVETLPVEQLVTIPAAEAGDAVITETAPETKPAQAPTVFTTHTGNGAAAKFVWQGISAAAILRYLGSKGMGTPTCRKVMAALGFGEVAEATIKTQRQLGRSGKGSKLPTLTAEQEQEIAKLAA